MSENTFPDESRGVFLGPVVLTMKTILHSFPSVCFNAGKTQSIAVAGTKGFTLQSTLLFHVLSSVHEASPQQDPWKRIHTDPCRVELGLMLHACNSGT